MNPENPEDVKMFMDACSVEAHVLATALYDLVTAQPPSVLSQIASLDALANTAARVIVTSTQDNVEVRSALMGHFIEVLKEHTAYYILSERSKDDQK